jgi:hypothetical protein
MFIPIDDETQQPAINKCVVWANKKNKLGDIVLIATLNGVDYKKTIHIVPLW